jgi:type II secretory pathway pseudopilin PulG
LKKLTKRTIKTFTLVEVLIALAIIMLLSAIATPTIIAYMNRAKVTRCYMEMGSLKTSLQTFYNDWNEYPASIAELRGTVTSSLNKAGSLSTTGIEGPIDYLAKDPPIDLFYKEVVASETKTYRYSTNTNKDDFVLWSYGPNKAGGTIGTWTTVAGTPPVTTFALTGKDIDDIIVRP